MTWLFIEPTDVWLFRDGRPFSAGEGHLARSLFPPTPLTVQGALRSLILGHSNVEWYEFRYQRTPAAQTLAQQIGHPFYRKDDSDYQASLGQFEMAGPFLARRVEDRVVRYTPLPLDVVKQKGKTERYFSLRPAYGINFDTAWPAPNLVPLWPETEEDIEAPEGAKWLNETGLTGYLSEQIFSVLDANHLFGSEPRFGTAMDYNKGRVRKEEGMLYQAEFIRPDNHTGLLVKLGDDIQLPHTSGLMTFGGEARGARYEVIANNNVEANSGVTKPTQQLKLILLTPAYFSGGWQPQDGDWSTFFNGQAVLLIAAAVGHPQYIGGWDVARNLPKPMRAYVPAGSTYFFEADQLIAPPVKPVTETPLDELPLGKLGFGQVAVGSWSWLNVS